MAMAAACRTLRAEIQELRQIMPPANDELERWQRYAEDAVLWASSALGFSPDPWQAEVMRSSSRRILLNCCRQSGKSTASALLALWTAIYRPGSLILCLSPSLRQSSELFHTVARYYNSIEDPLPSRAESALRMELANGSRIISLPGQESTVRGYAGVSLLIVDEAARVPDDLYYSIRPMLAVSQGRLIGLSTPWGMQGWFFKEWKDGQGWQKVSIAADQCPRISKEFLAEERTAMPEGVFLSEYYCQFREREDALLSYETISDMFDSGIKPLFPSQAAGIPTEDRLPKPDSIFINVKPLDLTPATEGRRGHV